MPATVVTRYFNLTSPASAKLTVNAVCYRGGRLRAEILDASTGSVVPGYSLNQSTPFEGDSVEAAMQWISNTKQSEGSLLPPAVKIKFELVKTRLYGFAIE